MKLPVTLTVPVFIAVISLSACSKDINIMPYAPPFPPPDYTSKLGGMRNWRGSYSLVSTHHGTYYDTSYNYPDTFIIITVVDWNTIHICGSDLTYTGSDSAHGILYFGTNSEDNGTGTLYFYNNDSIVYHHNVTLAEERLRQSFNTYP